MTDADSPIPARRAAVVPRARRVGTSACLPLDQLIVQLLQTHRKGIIYVTAPPGGGKTTALEHLRAVLPAYPRVGLFDEPRNHFHYAAAGESVVVVAQRSNNNVMALAVFELAPWSADDCLEYLAATHREQCASVMSRLHEDASLALLQGCPQLLAYAMDAMAADASLAGVSDALRRLVWDMVPPGRQRDDVTSLCTRRLRSSVPATPDELKHCCSPQAIAFLRHRPVQIILSADAIAAKLANSERCPELHGALDRPITREIVAAVRLRPAASQHLERLVNGPDQRSHSMAATILLATDPFWRPTQGREMDLENAVLSSAHWAGLDLSGSALFLADLIGANLSEANLSDVNASGAMFTRANLSSAMLHRFRAPNGNFNGACMANVRATEAHFEQADMEDVNLRSAELRAAIFMGTNLKRARLNGADLSEAQLAEPDIEEADFSHSDFNKAMLFRVEMNVATWDGASFVRARLDQCNLEGLELNHADFSGADLSESLLTGSRMTHATFRAARLANCGLAEINWEGADLRDADFTNASFHMGSSRGGLVGSVIPCEGSKTGFYSDEYTEQDYKCPEEIRKANLCGADLRGAKVHDTDWYLVDLRGATYAPEQARHFARCGAILKERASRKNF
jgi:uncharacterized protein YjbI with pentapeptide repeats